MNRPHVKGIVALRKEAHQSVRANFEALFDKLYGPNSDMVLQAISATALFDVLELLGLEQFSTADTSTRQAAMVMLAGYLDFYAERQIAE